MEHKNLPIVAIVGQPNAGKSTILNKIAGQDLAVTSSLPGTTRDRQYADTSWNGVSFTLVDTAGLSLRAKDELEQSLNGQIEIALEEADVVLLVVDGRFNRSGVQQSLLQKFQKIRKPLILAVNKIESIKKREEKFSEFRSLGIKPMFLVSAISGVGIGDMLDEIAEQIRKLEIHSQPQPQENGISVAIVGKPNVGKSSIFNSILKEDRVVVSPLPGTTRTAIDSHIQINGQDFTFIDTAGLKKKEYRQEKPDIYGGFQTFKSIRRSDICFLVLDASESLTKQDQRVGQEIFSQQKGCIILANKIDRFAYSKEISLRDYISLYFPFLWMSPLIFVSAKTGRGLEEAIAAIKPIDDRRRKKIDDQNLSEFLNKMLAKNPPKLLRDQKKPKVFSLHQTGINPPHFELLVNHPAAISQQFRKFLENSIIRELDFYGTPIVLRLKGKDKS